MFVQLSREIKRKMKKIENNIASNIKYYRKLANLTQEQLAGFLNGKKSLVSNYENGYSTPDIYTLISLADLFKISLDELVGRNIDLIK